MKNILFSVSAALSVLFLFVSKVQALAPGKEIIVFSRPCSGTEAFKSFCETDLKRTYPGIFVKIIDLKDNKNTALMHKYLKAYNVNPKYTGMPIVFIGSNYLTRWHPDDKKRLYFYIDEYIKEPMTRFPPTI